MDFDRYDRIRPIRWQGDHLSLLDQRKLPFVAEYEQCHDSEAVAAAIHVLVVRGAPAIGIAAAWGAVLAGQRVMAANGAEALAKLEPALAHLKAARPTAVNLAWALDRIRRVLVTEADRPWSAAARRLAEGFSWEDNAAAVLACYDDVLRGRHAVRPIAA